MGLSEGFRSVVHAGAARFLVLKSLSKPFKSLESLGKPSKAWFLAPRPRAALDLGGGELLAAGAAEGA